MATSCSPLVTALLIGANVALVFSAGLIIHARCVTPERVEHTAAWRMTPPRERPADGASRRRAGAVVQRLSLQFARAAAGAAIVLSTSALFVAHA